MLQEAIEAHGLHRLQPVATAIVAQEERTYCNGPRPRPLSRKTARLWQRVRERTSYSPRLQALPAPLVETSTEAVQHSYLALHAEKKAGMWFFKCLNDACFQTLQAEELGVTEPPTKGIFGIFKANNSDSRFVPV